MTVIVVECINLHFRRHQHPIASSRVGVGNMLNDKLMLLESVREMCVPAVDPYHARINVAYRTPSPINVIRQCRDVINK